MTNNNISAEKIKALRIKTGAGMMDCKNALVENEGEVEKAVEWLRKKGIAKADKKSSRTAAEGLIGINSNDKLACIMEVNSETDFVSKNEDFQKFINQLLQRALEKKYSIDDFLSSKYDQENLIGEALKNLISKIGENIVIRRLDYLDLQTQHIKFGYYLHNKVSDYLGKIGCIVVGNDQGEESKQLLKKIAMHISASKPITVREEDLDDSLINKEKEIYAAQLSESGKPKDIIDKIVNGKVKKFISEITLLNQNWIMDPNKKVKNIIDDFNKEFGSNFSIIDFKLFILGEGVETKTKDFKDEVASQLNDNS
tara:strand:- start:1 stop:936 length:936 start_codon:yes stop_codon:yes gene_type:complete